MLGLLGAKGRLGFSPRSVPGLRVWLDAGRITGLADGAAVATWPDVSGRGNDAAQADPAKRPLYKVGVVNGRPVVRFDGANDYLANGTVNLAQPNTIGLVAKQRVSQAADRDLVDGGAAGTRNNLYLSQVDAGHANMTMWAGAARNLGAVTVGAFHVIVAAFNGGSSAGYVDGSQLGATGNAGAQAFGGYTLGALFTGGAEFLDGDIAEVAVYNRLLSVAERRRLERYLGWKYGVAIT